MWYSGTIRSFVLLPLVISSGVLAITDDANCVSPVTLLEGRRNIDGATLKASNSMPYHRPSEARLNGKGWCSAQLGADIFDPYLEVNFGTSVLFTAIVTEGISGALPLDGLFLERYQVELAREDGHLYYLVETNSTEPKEAAIFPLERNRIASIKQYTQQFPMPMIGQTLRINPYEWSDNDHACTRLEVYGCPLQECQEVDQLGNNADTVVTVNGIQISNDDLFDFGYLTGRYCISTDTRPPTLNISFSTSVLLMEIGIRGMPFPLPLLDQFVQSFSLSYVVNDNNITNYTRANGLTSFRVADSQTHYFGLWPPVRTNQLIVTIQDWQVKPCLNIWMSGCASSDVVEHSIDSSASSVGLVDDPVVIQTTTETVIVSTTVFVTTTVESLPSHVTMTASNSLLSSSTMLNPTPTQGSSTVCSGDDDDDDNTPIYVSIVIVLVGVFVTAVIVIVGVILCRRRTSSSQMRAAQSSDPLIPKGYGSVSAAVGVDNDLYGRPELQKSRVEEDSDEEPLPVGDEPPNNPIYEEPPRDLVGSMNVNNPTYGALGDSDHSIDNIYSDPTQ